MDLTVITVFKDALDAYGRLAPVKQLLPLIAANILLILIVLMVKGWFLSVLHRLNEMRWRSQLEVRLAERAWRMVRSERGKSKALARPPGALLERFGRFFWSKKTFERRLAPVISDMREEYFEALHAGNNAQARWIWIRGNIAFARAAGLHAVLSAFETVATSWKGI